MLMHMPMHMTMQMHMYTKMHCGMHARMHMSTHCTHAALVYALYRIACASSSTLMHARMLICMCIRRCTRAHASAHAREVTHVGGPQVARLHPDAHARSMCVCAHACAATGSATRCPSARSRPCWAYACVRLSIVRSQSRARLHPVTTRRMRECVIA
jgi:hypothetical protein